MEQFYVIEVQRFADGTFAHNVFWEYDENLDTARLKAESKYHAVLSAAAISSVKEPSAILFSSQGDPIMYQCYVHPNVEAEE